MNKIIKCNLGVQYVAEDADAKNIYVTINEQVRDFA